MKRNFRVLIALFVMVFLVAGCAGWQLGAPDDPIELRQDKAYMVAVKEFALTLQDYNRHYALADAETKVEWKLKYPPLFHEANNALADWKTALDNNWDPLATEQIYLSLKARLLVLLLDVTNN